MARRRLPHSSFSFCAYLEAVYRTDVVLSSQSLLDRSGLNAHSILQAVEGLLDATSGADADLLLRYRECHLLVLKALQDGRAYGPQWCNKQITRCVYVGTVFVQNGISCTILKAIVTFSMNLLNLVSLTCFMFAGV